MDYNGNMKANFFVYLTFTLIIAGEIFCENEKDCSTTDNWNLNEYNESDWTSGIIDTRGFFLNAKARKVVKNVLAQMPCGWPEYGIPPLAPYHNEQLEYQIVNSVIESITKLIRFKVIGLNNMKIKKLHVGYTFSQKVVFDFVFKNITAISKEFFTNTTINLLEDYGIRFRLNGSGNLETFSLENLSISGSFKYKMPFIFGSIKIYKLKLFIKLGKCTSKINNFFSHDGLNKLINERIEKLVPSIINENQKKISSKIEPLVTERTNKALKGKKFWSILKYLFKTTPKCVPPPDPWMRQNDIFPMT